MEFNTIIILSTIIIGLGGIGVAFLYAIHALKDIPENKTKKSH